MRKQRRAEIPNEQVQTKSPKLETTWTWHMTNCHVDPAYVKKQWSPVIRLIIVVRIHNLISVNLNFLNLCKKSTPTWRIPSLHVSKIGNASSKSRGKRSKFHFFSCFNHLTGQNIKYYWTQNQNEHKHAVGVLTLSGREGQKTNS